MKRKLQINVNSLGYAYLYLNVLCKGIGLENDSNIYFGILILGFLLLMIKILNSTYKENSFYLLIIFTIVAVGTLVVTRKPTLALSCLCVAGMCGLDSEKTIESMYYIRLITFCGVVGLALFGVLDNPAFTQWRNGHVDVRYALGFGYPNTLHLSLFLLVALFLCKQKGILKLSHYIILFAVNTFVYHYSGSRAGFSMIILLLLLNFCANLLRNMRARNIILRSTIWAFVGLTIISFAAAMLYGKVEILNVINTAINNRLQYTNYYLTNYGITAFGIPDLLSDANANFDVSYVFVYLQYGLFGFITWFVLTWASCKYILINNDLTKAIVAITLFIYLLIESFGPNIFMNFVLLFGADYLMNYSDMRSRAEIYQVKSGEST